MEVLPQATCDDSGKALVAVRQIDDEDFVATDHNIQLGFNASPKETRHIIRKRPERNKIFNRKRRLGKLADRNAGPNQ